MTPPTVTSVEALAEFVSQLSFNEIPPDVRDHGTLALLDTLGCGLFGSTLPWASILLTTLRQSGAPGSSLCWGGDTLLAPADTALINGTAVHGFELDDLHPASIVHLGSVVIPAVLAIAGDAPDTTGARLLTAIVAGYETGSRVGAALGTPHLLQGWHPTGTHGTIAAAAAAASILGLDPEHTAHAIALGATSAAGLMGAQYGGMAKRLHAGRAAAAGLQAALLASHGFTGAPDALEQEYGGYCTTFAPTYEPSMLTRGLGHDWETLRVGFKPYSTNGSCHPTIDILRDLRSREGLKPSEIASVRLHVSTATLRHVGWPYRPADVTSAQMNLRYIAAVSLVDGDAFVDQFTDSRIRDPSLVELAERIEVVADPDIDAGGPSLRHATTAVVTLLDGRELTARRDHARGGPLHPLSRDQILEKFSRLARTVLDQPQVDQLRSRVLALSEETASSLLECLCRAEGSSPTQPDPPG